MARQSLRHLAIIMDGNGRYAQSMHKNRSFGHYQGAANVRNIALACLDYSIEVLTLFAFSSENWKRPAKEVDYLMSLPALFFDKFFQELMANNIKIDLLGNRQQIYPKTLAVLDKACEKSKNNTGLKLVFALNYGGQQEIAAAAQAYALDDTKSKQEDITVSEFEQYLASGAYGPVDLCIRTSLEYRISNFLLWQLAYAEFIFYDKYWPQFTPADLALCIEQYYQRNRRFGGI